MKSAMLLAAAILFGATLFAAEEDSFCSPCKFVVLGTNTDCKVVCQVRYENLLNANSPDETELNRNDKIVNLGIERFLEILCNGMTDDERVMYFASGDIQACVSEYFEPWLANYIDKINMKYGDLAVAVKIYDVKLRPVGTFADAVVEAVEDLAE